MNEMLSKLRRELRPIYGNRETEAIIRLIFHYVKGWSTVDILVHQGDVLSDFAKTEIEGILGRLLHHEPIQYITGEARFHGMDLKVTPDVLIPRPETDELTDMVISDCGDREDLRVLDVATGSGCIAIALARNLRFASVTAIDVSEKALEVARENAVRLKAKVDFIHADVFKWNPSASYDVIVSNPPYIDESERESMEANVTDYEPSLALFVPDSDPLRFYRRICAIACDSLKGGGSLYFEINPRHSADMVSLLEGQGFVEVEVYRDSYGKERFVKALKPRMS